MKIAQFILLSLTMSTALSAQTPLKIMSFNVRRDSKEKTPERKWERRKSNTIKVITSQQPDILSLQEPLENQVKDIAQGLDQQFPNRYKWVGEPRGARWCFLDTNEYNPIFYNPEKFRLLDSGTFWINKSFKPWNVIWGYEETGFLRRIATWAAFEIKATGQKLFIFNTHFDNKYQGARQNNIAHLLKKMKIVVSEGKDLPIILMGDFNTEAPVTFAREFKEAGFENTKELTTQVSGPKNTGSDWTLEKTKPIDHMLIKQGSPAITVKNYCAFVDKTLSSDHFPIIVEMIVH